MLAQIVKTEERYNEQLPQSPPSAAPTGSLIAAAKLWSDRVWDMACQLGAITLTIDQVNKGLQLAMQPVFICGVHRSGTTLVRDLLDGHPELVVLPSEGSYYTNLEKELQALPAKEHCAFLGKEWLRRLANPINQPPFWLLGRSTGNHSQYVEFARHVLAWWNITSFKKLPQPGHLAIVLAYASCTNQLHARMWVDKTPANERFIKRIRSSFSEAKIIQLIREPEAILCSRKKLDPGFNVRWVLREMKTSFRIALRQQALQGQHYMLVHYERLCMTPEDNAKLLADYLQVGQSPSMLQPTVAGIPSTANTSFRQALEPGKIYKWDASRGEQVLSGTEKKLLAAYLGNVAGKLGYAVAHVNLVEKLYLLVRYRLWR